MLEPRRPTGPSGSSAAMVATSSMTRPSIGPSLAPCPRWSNTIAAIPCARSTRATSKWFSLHEPAPCRTTTPPSGSRGRQEQGVRQPLVDAEVGGRVQAHRAHGAEDMGAAQSPGTSERPGDAPPMTPPGRPPARWARRRRRRRARSACAALRPAAPRRRSRAGRARARGSARRGRPGCRRRRTWAWWRAARRRTRRRYPGPARRRSTTNATGRAYCARKPVRCTSTAPQAATIPATKLPPREHSANTSSADDGRGCQA